MKKLRVLFLLIGCFACKPAAEDSSLHTDISTENSAHMKLAKLDRETLYDKILGSFVGSAIGDAMGAPTEMWSRENIQMEYGHVNSLDDMVREPSAEGTWAYNLPGGSTTDDTRWKVLLADFLTDAGSGLGGHQKTLSATSFAKHIRDHYAEDLRRLKQTEGLDLDPYEEEMRKLAWLKEWVQVARPYADNDLEAYSEALSRFYGGEMVCAGMLFAPAIGAYYPGDPEWAYSQAYAVDIFDLGYARDMSGLTAAMISAAFHPETSPDSIIHVVRHTDPKGYYKSRLVGRSSYKAYQRAMAISSESRGVDVDKFFREEAPVKLAIELKTHKDSLTYAQWSTAYKRLDAELMNYPFHPREIYLVNMVALMMCEFDFVQTLSFIINFGRDNDTTAAVTGAILGAYWGASGLPEEMLAKALKANRELGIDLEEVATRMTASIMGAM